MTERTLKALRCERRISQIDLATAAGVSLAWLGRLERHDAAMTPRVAAILAPYLGVTAGALREAHEAERVRRRAEVAGRLTAGA